jgi:hypothetical protein
VHDATVEVFAGEEAQQEAIYHLNQNVLKTNASPAEMELIKW